MSNETDKLLDLVVVLLLKEIIDEQKQENQ
ncbi:MAG: hypothetical protein H6Q73_3778 [Firmicutes bacterium]|nr:hypothetical protein [Bacillota bacterium]